MSTRERQPFPLVPRRRLTGLPFGDQPGRRRGHGHDIIGHRTYEPGDPVTTIDWFASARLSAATGGDEFVVRDHAADEAPRVAIAVDRRPAMALYPDELPWLHKPDALREALTAIVVSALAARADIGGLDFAGGETWWLAPGRRDRARLLLDRTADFDAPDDSVERALAFLGRHRADLPAGSFVFVLSDFLAPPPREAWRDPVLRGLDVVPVVVQDPVWEQSFPDVGGVAVPVAGVGAVRLSRRQADERRRANEARRAELLAELEAAGARPVTVSTTDPLAIDRAFLEWAEERRRGRVPR